MLAPANCLSHNPDTGALTDIYTRDFIQEYCKRIWLTALIINNLHAWLQIVSHTIQALVHLQTCDFIQEHCNLAHCLINLHAWLQIASHTIQTLVHLQTFTHGISFKNTVYKSGVHP